MSMTILVVFAILTGTPPDKISNQVQYDVRGEVALLLSGDVDPPVPAGFDYRVIETGVRDKVLVDWHPGPVSRLSFPWDSDEVLIRNLTLQLRPSDADAVTNAFWLGFIRFQPASLPHDSLLESMALGGRTGSRTVNWTPAQSWEEECGVEVKAVLAQPGTLEAVAETGWVSNRDLSLAGLEESLGDKLQEVDLLVHVRPRCVPAESTILYVDTITAGSFFSQVMHWIGLFIAERKIIVAFSGLSILGLSLAVFVPSLPQAIRVLLWVVPAIITVAHPANRDFARNSTEPWFSKGLRTGSLLDKLEDHPNTTVREAVVPYIRLKDRIEGRAVWLFDETESESKIDHVASQMLRFTRILDATNEMKDVWERRARQVMASGMDPIAGLNLWVDPGVDEHPGDLVLLAVDDGHVLVPKEPGS